MDTILKAQEQLRGAHHRLMMTLQAANPNVLMVIAALAGLFFLGLTDAFPSKTQVLPLILSCLGNCLLVLAVASKFMYFRWVRRSRFFILLLYIGYAAGSASIAVKAIYDIRKAYDPNTWLTLKSRPVGHDMAVAARNYYLADLTPNSGNPVERVEGSEKEPGPARRLLSQQAKLREENDDDLGYVFWCEFSNTGRNTVSGIELPLTIVFSSAKEGTSVPPKKIIALPVHSLAPGEKFRTVFFSADPDIYSSVFVPKTVDVHISENGFAQTLKLNRPPDDFILVKGTDRPPEEKKPVHPASDPKPGKPSLQDHHSAERPAKTRK